MTSNAIAAMRLQEEKRHNMVTEGQTDKARKAEFAQGLLGSAIRGLGTGIIAKVLPTIPASSSIQSRVKFNNKERRGK